MERSTRLSILEHALADVVERLGELPDSAEAGALRARLRHLQMEVALWEEHPPEEAARVALLKSVLDLSVEVMRRGGPTTRGTLDEAREAADGDHDDDYPKPL